MTAVRHVYAKNRWHAVLVGTWAALRHPCSDLLIHVGGKRNAT